MGLLWRLRWLTEELRFSVSLWMPEVKRETKKGTGHCVQSERRQSRTHGQ